MNSSAVERPLTVAHIIPRDGYGGVESAARSMAARSDLSCDFHLLFITGPTVAHDRARIRTSGYKSSLNPLAYLQTLRSCLGLAPQVVIFSLWRSVPLLLVLRLIRPHIRCVFTVNVESSTHLADRVFAWLACVVCDEIWTDSAVTLASRVTSAGRVGRIISFVTERHRPARADAAAPAAHFVCWARLSPQKGLDRAIDLVALSVERGIDARLDVYGPDDGELERLSQASRAKNVAERVRFHGPIDRSFIPTIAANASFFLLPSRFEGMSMACVEAMQLGLVPVVTAVGEMARYVDHGRNGIILDPDNLAQAVDDVLALIDKPDRFANVRDAAIATWADVPLYAEDVCQAAEDLAQRHDAGSKAGLN